MEGVTVLFIVFVTGLYSSIAAFSINEYIENKKREKKRKYDKINSKLKEI